MNIPDHLSPDTYKSMDFEELKKCKELSTDPNAQYELGLRYVNPEDSDRYDLKKGCKYLRKAMQGGHPDARSSLTSVLNNDVNCTKYWMEYIFDFFL